jgi:hypothetical protein
MQHYTVIYVAEMPDLDGAKRITKHSLDSLAIARLQAKDPDVMRQHVFNLLVDAWGYEMLENISAYYFHKPPLSCKAAFIRKLEECCGALHIVFGHGDPYSINRGAAPFDLLKGKSLRRSLPQILP